MNKVISGVILTRPTPKARPRAGRNWFYTPKRTKDAEKIIKDHMIENHLGAYLKGSIVCNLTFYFKSKKPGEHVARPDLDNLGKLFTDACNGIIYDDDSQIYSMGLRKFYDSENKIEYELWECARC